MPQYRRWKKEDREINGNDKGERYMHGYAGVETFGSRHTPVPHSFERRAEVKIESDHSDTIQN